MKLRWNILLIILIAIIAMPSCNQKQKTEESMQPQNKITAQDILGNPEYLAISYGGYRKTSREHQPTIEQLKEDMRILHAMNIRLLRTYNVQLAQASNLLEAIKQLMAEDENFEMYVMLGAWIDCKNAWTDLEPDHNVESEQNEGEIKRAVKLANKYPEIVKIIAVGNEAMVKWAESYYVQPDVILKWVNHLQELKKAGELSENLWITSSDDFASWGGGDSSYHVKDLEDLIKAVDYISMHTYPYHNTHYNPEFWGIQKNEDSLSHVEKIDLAMQRARQFAQSQYKAVHDYMKSVGVDKPIHIGETGWATVSNGYYGPNGSKASDEYKEALYYNNMREWTNKEGISCFYFEAFDEPWKDAHNSEGSENHFGLFTVDGKAKYVLWEMVDKGMFNGLTRDGNKIVKSYEGDKTQVLEDALLPEVKGKVAVGF